MKQYISSSWRDILSFNHLDSFEKLWQLEIGWVEEFNKGRGGWSGVSRLSLRHPQLQQVNVYIKRQQNHTARGWRHPIKGAPTFQREARNILKFKEIGVPTLDMVYYGERIENNNLQSILITLELTDYLALSDWIVETTKDSLRKKKHVITKLANIVRKMHDAKYRHGCLYPKHIFIRDKEDEEIDIRLIDLEKARYWPIKSHRIIRDLYSMNRLPNFSNADRLRFVLSYFKQSTLTNKIKKIINKVLLRNIEKQRVYRVATKS